MALLLPFGWDLALVATLLNVTVEASPLGSGNLDICMFASTDTTGLVELHHGQLYENTLAIEAMSKWIEAAERRTQPA
jgi:hypothetical protein